MASLLDGITMTPAPLLGRKVESARFEGEGEPPAYIIFSKFGNIAGGYVKTDAREADRPV